MNPNLYQEISATLEIPSLSSADVEELAFLETVNDVTDTPLDVVQEHIHSSGTLVAGGFRVDSDGEFVQTGSGENLDMQPEDFGQVNIEEPLGQSCQIRSKPSHYGGENMWG